MKNISSMISFKLKCQYSLPKCSITSILIYIIYFLLTFFLMLLATVNPQVKIKEKVNISPSIKYSAKLNSASSSGHTLKAVCEWEQTYIGENNDIPVSRMRFKVKTPFCSDEFYSSYDYSGHLEYSLSNLKGTSYSITILLSQRTLWDPIYRYEAPGGGWFDVYADDELVATSNNSISVSPWYANLGLYIYGNEIDYYGYCKNMDFHLGKECKPIIGVVDEDWPTIKITEGHEYLSFYVEGLDDTLGDVFNSEDYLSNFPKIIYDQPYYKSDEKIGIVMAEVNGVTAFDTIKINPVDDFELNVQTIPHKIKPSQAAAIKLNQVFYYGMEEFPPDQLFNVEIIEGADYGTFVLPNGLDTADAFFNIPQGFYYCANNSINSDSVEVFFKVTTEIEEDYILTSMEGQNTPSANKNTGSNQSSNSEDKKSDSASFGNNASFIFIPPDETREIFGIGSVKIIDMDSLEYFELVIVPDTMSSMDTLAFTETASLFVQAKDADSSDIDLNDEELITFEVVTNKEYGTFIDQNGDTLKTDSVVLENITYGDAKAGKIKFAAVKGNPETKVKCRIKISLQSDSTKNGNSEAVVLEQTLRIILAGDGVVEPIITGRRYDPESNSYLNSITINNREAFKVNLTRGGRSILNHRIKLRSEYIDGSGGHNHLLPRRPDSSYSYQRYIWENNKKILKTFNIDTEKIRRQNFGSFYSYSFGEIFNVDEIKGMVFSRAFDDTVTRFEYISSIWGGETKIIVESIENNNLLKDSIVMQEKIPCLMKLENNPNYILIGGTNEHHGPPDYLVDNNHYGTSKTNLMILNIAREYGHRYEADNLKLVINDMSLPNGGKFDIDGNWSGSHVKHRTGKNVDIRSRNMKGDRYFDANRNGIYDPRNQKGDYLLVDHNSNARYDGDEIEIFRNICKRNYAKRILLENPASYNGFAEHWHIEF